MPYVSPTIFAATIGPMRQMVRICPPARPHRIADVALGRLSFHLDCPNRSMSRVDSARAASVEVLRRQWRGEADKVAIWVGHAKVAGVPGAVLQRFHNRDPLCLGVRVESIDVLDLYNDLDPDAARPVRKMWGEVMLADKSVGVTLESEQRLVAH